MALRSTVALGSIFAGALALWFAIHHVPWLGPALADGVRAVVGPKPVAWAEDTFYGWQDRWNRWRYGDSKPVSYWAASSASGSAPVASEPAPPVPSGDGGAGVNGFPPAAFTPPSDRVAGPGDGQWVPAMTAPEGGKVVLYKTMVHPDPKRPFAALAIVAMEMQGIRLHAVAGTVEPRSKDGAKDKRPGLVEASDADNLLAAFNGGFLTIHGHYGMMVDGTRIGDPRPTSCTVAIYRDGTVRVRSWPELEPTESQMVAFRQTPQCLVEQGRVNPALHADNTSWGAAVGGATVIRRSAIGLSQDGRILFFGMGDALTVKSIADGMMAAGAYDIAQLDVNHSFPRFMFYQKKSGAPGEFTVTGLVPGFTFQTGDYIKTPSFRDFFYVTLKAPPTT
ncbi:MAG: phosphodiester glycosidase family protein [Deltaproteobacteria bacterium]|nr:phosphodiester glycosidase family protein [Deltaproteobacteria bacterium]